MRLSQQFGQQQTMRQQQIMAPRMIQMLKRFQLSYSDLVTHIEEERKDNVFIEVVREDRLGADKSGHRKLSAKADYTGDEANSFLDQASVSETLKEHLITQLDLEFLGPKEKGIATWLIDALDERGFLTNYPQVRSEICTEFGVKDRKVSEVLKVVQSLEPEGVGARDLKECLLIQVREMGFESDRLVESLEQVIRDHLDDIANDRYNKIAKAMDIDEEGVDSLVSFIRDNLTPNPGAEFGSVNRAQHVTPSFAVVMGDDSVVLTNLEKEQGVSIQVSDQYEKLLGKEGLDEDSKTFLNAQHDKAKELVEQVRLRYENLEKLAQYIVERQMLFLKYGESYLEPLHQKSISEALDISPSTVSRIVSSKYIQTPHGLFPLKRLCPRNHFGKTAERLKLIISDLAVEFPEYSDEQLRDKLKGIGVDIARRTVAKYRLLAGVESSYERLRED
ncbi:RNA polymerase factor sigma-54 [bacterium]|jgi:RNA polymerase sigma-54 factor|nr:RNA polymerase factor sigma-54 [bacterium]